LKELLDTRILVRWVSHPGDLSAAQRHVAKLASAAQPLLVASISLWEVATLVSLGRLRLDRALRGPAEKQSLWRRIQALK